jgi:hypothetical protein
MHVFTITDNTQGRRANDFQSATPGELVSFSMIECEGEKVDGSCGCRRSFSGLQSLRAGTTVVVEDRPTFTPTDLRKASDAALERGGWLFGTDDEQASLKQEAYDELVGLYAFACTLPVGTVVERRGTKLQARKGVI